LSPGERQRTKSRSSSRSRRTPSTTAVHEADARHNKTSPKTSKRRTRETKRAGSSTSNPSPKSNALRKQKSKVKKSPSPTRKGHSKRKKAAGPISDVENVQAPPPNDDERQDLSSRGLSVVPGDIFDRM
jgi:hypothetical protein